MVNWSFIDLVLKNTGFGVKWRNWINFCILSAFMSILINNSPIMPFEISKVLRQGDPLSPFPFILVAKVFNSMVNRVKDLGLLKGI